MDSKYYDRLVNFFNLKNWKRWNNLKFGPDKIGFGKRLQSSELNEIQSIPLSYDERMGKTLLSEGEIVAGCDLAKLDSTMITIAEGFVFVDGRVRKISDTRILTITGIGKEYIKLNRKKKLIKDTNVLEDLGDYTYDVEENSSLLFDLASGWDNYTKGGAYREAYVYTWYVDSTQEGIVSIVLDNGGRSQDPIGNLKIYNKFWQDVARRTYEESGNYTVTQPIIRAEEITTDSTAFYDSTEFYIVVEPFRGYIKGWSVEVSAPQRILMDKSRDIATATLHVTIQDSTTVTYLYDLITGTDIPPIIKSITLPNLANIKTVYPPETLLFPFGEDYTPSSCDAIDFIFSTLVLGERVLTPITNEEVTRGAGNFDNLIYKDGIQASVTNITDENSVKYYLGIDFLFITGNRPTDVAYTGVNYATQIGYAAIYWIPTGRKPGLGVKYYLDYEYWEHTEEGNYVTPASYDRYDKITTQLDFTIVSEDFDLRRCLDFRSSNLLGNGDYDGVEFDVAVEYYLYRTDTIYVNQYAEVKVIKGNGSKKPYVATKLSEDTLTIGYVILGPYTFIVPDNIDIIVWDNQRYTMLDIHKLEKRIDNLEYFTSLDILEQNALATDTIALKKGIFTDGFEGSKRSDLFYDDGTFSTTVSFDMKDKAIKLPFSITQNQSEYDEIQTTALLNDKVFTLPFEEQIFARQLYASRSKSMQPFGVFEWAGELSTVPASDIFVDIETIPVHLNADYSVTIGGEQKGELDHLLNPFKQGHGSWNTLIAGYYDANTTEEVVDPGPPLGIMSVIENKIVDLSLSPFIRESEITIFGDNLRPSTDDLILTLDGVEMYAHDASPEPDVLGRIKTDANGAFMCKMKILAGTFTVGEKLIRVDNKTTAVEADRTFATYKYFAQGTIETRYDTYLSSIGYQTRSEESDNAVLSEKREFTIANQPDADKILSLDALAQSFRTDDRDIIYISSIDIYFKSKDDNVPVTMCIVEMKNGYPTRKIIEQITLKPDDINISSDASLATGFNFPDPVALNPGLELAFTLFTGSKEYEIFYSVLGEKDLKSSNVIRKNPYAGVMFTSPNQRTWEADGFADLKFTINTCNFENECQIIFNDIDAIQAGNIVLNTTQILPDETDIKWFYSVDGGETWKQTIPNMDNFLQTVATKVSLKADITGEGLSPMINKERTGLIFVLYDAEGYYVSRLLELDAIANNIKVIIKQSAPSGTALNLYYKIKRVGQDQFDDWQELTTSVYNLLDLEHSIYEVTFEENVSNFLSIRFAIKFSTENRAITPSIKSFRAICS